MLGLHVANNISTRANKITVITITISASEVTTLWRYTNLIIITITCRPTVITNTIVLRLDSSLLLQLLMRLTAVSFSMNNNERKFTATPRRTYISPRPIH